MVPIMEVKLLVVNEKAGVRELVLGAETYIGRSPECHLRISSSRVSRKHCLIRVDENQVTVRDLGSSNGTVLDGMTVAKGVEARVRPGSKLVVGPLKFMFDFDSPEPVDQSGYISPSDVLSLGEVDGDDDDTKDYLPSTARAKRAARSAAEQQPRTASPKRPVASANGGPGAPSALPPLNPEETVYDSGLADHAHRSAQQSRDDSASVLSESGTDLLREEDGLDEPAPPHTPTIPDRAAEDPALQKFLKQFDS